MASSETTPAPISLAKSPFVNWLGFGFTNAMSWMIALGTPMVLLAGELGASTFEVGIAYASVFIVLPVQILATSTLPRFGYKWQMIFGWGTRSFFLLVPLYLAILAPEHPQRWMVLAMVGSVVLFTLFRALGSCATWPWMYSLIPDGIRGRYFATDQVLSGISGVLTLVFCGLLFSWLPPFEAYTWQYSFALLGSMLSVAFLISIPDVPKPEFISVGTIFQEMPRWTFRPGKFRQYLRFMLTSNVVVTSISPFTVYYLKVEKGYAFDTILFLSAIQYSGSILASLWIRKRIDQAGPITAFRIGYAGLSALMLYWALIVCNVPHTLMFLQVAYFAFGASNAHWSAAHMKYLPSVCPDQKRALTVSIHSSVVGFLGGLTPILWGLLLRTSGASAGVNKAAFLGFLIFACLVLAGLSIYASRLVFSESFKGSLFSRTMFLRSFRFIEGMVRWVPSSEDSDSGINPNSEKNPENPS